MRPPWKAAFTGSDSCADGQGDSVRGGRRARRAAERAPPCPAFVEGHTGVDTEQTTRRVCNRAEQVCCPKRPRAHAWQASARSAGRARRCRTWARGWLDARGVRSGCARPGWRVRTPGPSTSPLEVQFRRAQPRGCVAGAGRPLPCAHRGLQARERCVRVRARLLGRVPRVSWGCVSQGDASSGGFCPGVARCTASCGCGSRGLGTR